MRVWDAFDMAISRFIYVLFLQHCDHLMPENYAQKFSLFLTENTLLSRYSGDGQRNYQCLY